jgi:hypothetical protein
MTVRYFALIYGAVFAIIGIAGFIPFLLTPYGVTDPDLAVSAGAGKLFGLFPVNVLHNLVHIAFGVWGLAAWRSMPSSRFYAKAVAVVYAIFVVMGFFPVLQTTFGLVPLHGNDIWLHLLLAAGAGYFGWGYRPEAVARHR